MYGIFFKHFYDEMFKTSSFDGSENSLFFFMGIANYIAKLFFRAFICHDHDCSLLINRTFIRPLLKSATQAWCSHHLQVIVMVENGLE